MIVKQVIFHQYKAFGKDDEIQIVVDVEVEHDWKIPDIGTDMWGEGVTFEETVRYGVENSMDRSSCPNPSTRYSELFYRHAEGKVRDNARRNTEDYYRKQKHIILQGIDWLRRRPGVPRVPEFPNFRITNITVHEPVTV